MWMDIQRSGTGLTFSVGSRQEEDPPHHQVSACRRWCFPGCDQGEEEHPRRCPCCRSCPGHQGGQGEEEGGREQEEGGEGEACCCRWTWPGPQGQQAGCKGCATQGCCHFSLKRNVCSFRRLFTTRVQTSFFTALNGIRTGLSFFSSSTPMGVPVLHVVNWVFNWTWARHLSTWAGGTGILFNRPFNINDICWVVQLCIWGKRKGRENLSFMRGI